MNLVLILENRPSFKSCLNLIKKFVKIQNNLAFLREISHFLYSKHDFFLAVKNDVNKSRPTSPTPQKNFLSRKKKLETAFKDSTVNFRNVAGLEDTLMELLYLMIGLQCDESSETETLLLHGPTGCGKTLLANAIAGKIQFR